jgi:large subunit ribosomal protein L3
MTDPKAPEMGWIDSIESFVLRWREARHADRSRSPDGDGPTEAAASGFEEVTMGNTMGILGRKVGMTQTFNEDGKLLPVTVVEAGPCAVLAVKTTAKDGYAAIQIGFDDQKKQRTNRPDLVRFSKVNAEPKRFVRELRLTDEEVKEFEVGQTLQVSDVFAAGDWIDVIGTSKGKGFQGVMKKYNFSGFEATHGTHEYFRHGGSIGCRLTPGRVVKGKRMPGRMGGRRVTTHNLQVVDIRDEHNVMLVKGAVPGHKKGYVIVKKAVKKKGKKADQSSTAAKKA